MAEMLLASRLLLCAVFLLAGFSKVRDRPGSRQSLLDFGVPELLARPFSLLLPIAEIVAAIGLLSASFAWISAAAVVALLLVFIVAIAVSLARGRAPDCRCFGQIHSKPIGWGLAGRDTALAAIAGLVVYAGPRQPSFLVWIKQSIEFSRVSALFFVALVVLVIQWIVIFQIIQQSGRLILRIEALENKIGKEGIPKESSVLPGLPVGDPAPDFELPDPEGNPVSLRQLLSASQSAMLLFTRPECQPCSVLLPETSAWQRAAAAHFNLAVLSQPTKDGNAKTNNYGIRAFLLQRDREVFDQYAARGTPSAVIVRADGRIGSPMAEGPEAIRSLVSLLINESVASPANLDVREGAIAPPLVFPDLDGRLYSLSELRGKPSILMFWNPGCPYCQKMSEELKTWEKKATKAGTQVVLISTGTVEANRDQRFRSTILLDQGFSAGKAFGAAGTPSALLLNDEARVVSKVVTGKHDILKSVFGTALKPS
jgi:peroxiredoxin/uncharacterized membrane protein YphA (DoxX/SURF4 family)